MAKNGKAPESKSIDSDRETRVLLENISRDVTRIAEAQSSASAQISEIKTTVNELLPLKSEVKAISMAVMTLSSELKEVKNDVKDLKNKVEEGLSNHDKRITKLEEKILV